MSTMVKSFRIGFRTEGSISIPSSVVLTVTANDDNEHAVFWGRSGRVCGIYQPGVGDHEVSLVSLGYVNDASLTIETVQATLKVSIGADKRAPVDLGIAAELPDAPVDVTNFSFTAWDPTDGVTFDEETQVSGGSNPIIAYRITDDATGNATLSHRVLLADLPFTFRLSPDTYLAWPFDDADGSFNIGLYVAAETEDGVGPFSSVRNVAVNAIDSFRIDPADLTITSLDNEGAEGLVRVQFAGGSGFTLESPYDSLWLYVGDEIDGIDPATMLPIDWAATANLTEFAVGGDVTVQSGVSVGSDAIVMVVARRSDTGQYDSVMLPLTVEILPLVVTPPVVVSGPTITGMVDHDGFEHPNIGVQVSGNTTWDDVDSYTNQFSIANVLVGSQANDAPATYIPVVGDNAKNLRLFSTGTKSGVTSQVTSVPYLVWYAAPVATGSLPAINATVGDGTQTVLAATVQAAFLNAAGGTYTVSSAIGATINPSTGEVSIPDPAAATSDTVTVTYTNSGGTVSQSFGVAFNEVADDFTFNIAPGDWTMREAVEADGFAEFSPIIHINNIDIPQTGYGMRIQVERDALSDLTGLTTTQKKAATQTAHANADTNWTKTAFTAGNVLKATIHRRQASTEDWRPVDIKQITTVGFTVTPPTTWIAPTQAMLNDANGRTNETFNSSDTSTNAGGWCGSRLGVLAYNSFTGDSSTDAAVLSGIRAALPGNKCPACNSGFSLQFETNNWFLGVTLAKLTPRVWNQLTSAQKNTIDLLFKAEAIAAAWASSDTRKANAGSQDTANWVKKLKKMDGSGNNYTWGNINYKMAPPYLLSLYGIYLGSQQAAKTFLDGGNFSSVISAIASAGLTNPGGGSFAANRTGKPSVNEVNTSCNNWKWKGIPVTDPVGLYQQLMQLNFSEVCFLHHPSTNEIGGRGALIGGDGAADAKLLSLVGKVGMPAELKATDGGDPNTGEGGVRTSVAYAMDGINMSWGWTIAMMASGLLPKTGTVINNLHDRIDNGYEWVLHAATIGWKNYAKGGKGGGNGDFKLSLPGSNGIPTIDKQFAVTGYNIPMWTTVIEPMIG